MKLKRPTNITLKLLKIYRLLPDGDLYKIGLLFLMMIIASFLTVAGIGIVPIFVAAIIDADKVLSLPVIGNFLIEMEITTPRRLAIFGSAALFMAYLLKNLFMFFYDYTINKYMLNRSLYIQNRLFRAYMYSPYTFFINRNSSELLRNINSEVNRVLEGTLKPALHILLHGIMSVLIITALIFVEPLITGFGFLIFGGFAFIFLKSTKNKISRYGSESIRHRNLMTKSLLEGLHGFKDSKVLKREAYFLKEFYNHASKHRIYDLWRVILNSLPRQIIEMIGLSGVLFVAVAMVIQGRDVTAIVPIIALFGAAIMKVKPSIYMIIEEINRFRYSIHSVDAVYDDLMHLEGKNTFRISIAESAPPLLLEKNIELVNIAFNYPKSNIPAVKNISFRFAKNKVVALVGSSGAGKTTLADLILGLHKPVSGEILVDGINIHDDIDRWQRNIGYIPQSIYLLDNSIRKNICFGIPENEIHEEKLKLAIKTAQLEELVNELDEGDRTMVGERGIRLSGGQVQRIGIARALYHDPQVLIMDEATSALDNITEKFVIEAIEQLRGEKTIIMIAHRLTTVQNCDTIYMMKNGEFIAEGDYRFLLNNSKEFREMSLIDT